jgi:AraC family transcriptional regulator of adaptative response/methylated-DNA-[protein]-cysteine methyltransferase
MFSHHRRAGAALERGALDGDDRSVDVLAERAGVGARHLTRLFAKHVQASPTRVARTVRVRRAKRLLDSTDLSMTEVALQAGFGSLCRFNTVFAKVYGRPPTEIRRRDPLSANRRISSPSVPESLMRTA